MLAQVLGAPCRSAFATDARRSDHRGSPPHWVCGPCALQGSGDCGARALPRPDDAAPRRVDAPELLSVHAADDAARRQGLRRRRGDPRPGTDHHRPERPEGQAAGDPQGRVLRGLPGEAPELEYPWLVVRAATEERKTQPPEKRRDNLMDSN